MSRYRLEPTPEQEIALLGHCADARYVWNLCVEQHACWRSGRNVPPGFAEQCRQLTDARADNEWLRNGSVNVQQQALRDFWKAKTAFFKSGFGHPSWRKKGCSDGFRITDKCETRRLNRHQAEVWVPKVGWIRFRWSRAVPEGAKSFRVTRDRACRWHIAFAVIPDPVEGPGTGEAVGIDRGVAVSAALSTGEMLTAPGLSAQEKARLRRLERKLARAKRGSNRRGNVRTAIARLKAREADRRKDWAEKLSTDLARRFDVIRVENLKIAGMTRSARGTIDEPGRNVAQKAGLNRGILSNGWGLLVRRLEDKAPGRVERVKPHFTSQRCSACGHIARESRESQALFRCVACGYTLNADVNAAINIAAGHAVKARGGDAARQPVNREPQLLPLSA
jgi:putative transposase